MTVTELSQEQSDRLLAVVFRAVQTREQMQEDLEDAHRREMTVLRQIAALSRWIDKGGADAPALAAARTSAIEHLEWIEHRIRRLETGIKTGTVPRDPDGTGLPGSLAEYQYRFNRRFDLPAMLPRLLRAVVLTKPHSLRNIRIPENSC